MNTEQLIGRLAKDVPPVTRHARVARFGVGALAGALISLAIVVRVLGLRPDFGSAVHGFPFWMKWSYTISLGLGAMAVVARLARPEAVRLSRFWPLALPVVLLAIVGAIEMAQVPSRDWLAIWLGATWNICPWLILLLSGPPFLGLLWSFRRLAPTRLRAAGAAAGLAAGAWAAVLYCIHCPEVAAIFVLTWYTLGMVLAACVGGLIGPRLLRW